jgi:hypothetical protein
MLIDATTMRAQIFPADYVVLVMPSAAAGFATRWRPRLQDAVPGALVLQVAGAEDADAVPIWSRITAVAPKPAAVKATAAGTKAAITNGLRSLAVSGSRWEGEPVLPLVPPGPSFRSGLAFSSCSPPLTSSCISTVLGWMLRRPRRGAAPERSGQFLLRGYIIHKFPAGRGCFLQIHLT